ENSEIKIKLERISKQINSLEDQISKTREKLTAISSQASDIESKLSEINIDEEVDEKIKQVRDSLVMYRSKLSTANSLIKILDKKNIDDEVCNYCGQNISEELHEKLIHEHNEEKSKYNKEIVFSNNKIEQSNLMLKKLESI